MTDSSLKLRWKRIGIHNLPMPSRARDDDAGIDLSIVVTATEPMARAHDAAESHRFTASPDELVVFRTGWAVEIPFGWFGFIVPRSSTGKAGWDIESSGVIDPNYRGEIMIPMTFRGKATDPARRVSHGQRMAQMLILPVPRIECEEVDELSATQRGEGGFGSTGR